MSQFSEIPTRDTPISPDMTHLISRGVETTVLSGVLIYLVVKVLAPLLQEERRKLCDTLMKINENLSVLLENQRNILADLKELRRGRGEG